MTPEQRLDRAERIVFLLAKAGYRARREWREQSRVQDEKINILLDAQIRHEASVNRQFEIVAAAQAKTEEEIKKTAVAQAKTEEEMKRTAAAQAKTEEEVRKTQEAVRNFINSQREGRNGKSSE